MQLREVSDLVKSKSPFEIKLSRRGVKTYKKSISIGSTLTSDRDKVSSCIDTLFSLTMPRCPFPESLTGLVSNQRTLDAWASELILSDVMVSRCAVKTTITLYLTFRGDRNDV